MLSDITAEEVAIAAVSAIRIFKSLLIENGVDPKAIEEMADQTADELMLSHDEQNASLLLRTMLTPQ